MPPPRPDRRTTGPPTRRRETMASTSQLLALPARAQSRYSLAHRLRWGPQCLMIRGSGVEPDSAFGCEARDVGVTEADRFQHLPGVLSETGRRKLHGCRGLAEVDRRRGRPDGAEAGKVELAEHALGCDLRVG